MSGLNIADIFETVVATVPDTPALVVRTGDGRDEVRFSFAELDARVNQLAHALAAMGIGEGDHVGCHLYDGNQYIEVTLAAYKLARGPGERELPLRRRGADVSLRQRRSEVRRSPSPISRSVRPARPRSSPGSARWWRPTSATSSCSSDQPTTAPDVGDRSPDDRYGLWTGGTTGMPKGVMWRQEDIYMSAIGGDGNPLLGIEPVKDLDDVAERVRTGSPLPGTLTLCPLMHGGGFWLAFSAILAGSFSVLIRDVGFDPDFALRVIGEEHVSLLMTIGDAYARPIVDLLERSGPDAYDLSSLLVYGSGGAILSPSVKEDIARLLPRTFVHDGFGASETGGQGRLIGTGADGAPRFLMDATNVVIADDGTLCAPGDGRVGMLATSGHIPLGYYKDEKKTAATFPMVNGIRYAVPGDMASVDADGSIAVYGRGSVSINSGGEKIFPEEVEKALKSHPAVFDATVIGTPNERFGSQVTAVVELRPEHADQPPPLAELQEHCRQHLAGYKVPRAVVFVDRTQRSPSGKPDYRWAKETALAGLPKDDELA